MNRESIRAAIQGLLVAGGLAVLTVGCVSAAKETAGPAVDPSTPSPVASAAGQLEPERTQGPPGRRLDVPASIDASGRKDVHSRLQAFLNDAPNGSTIVFKAGGTYRLGEVLRVLGKKRVTLDGNGATLKLTGPIDFFGAGIFVEQLSEDITIRDLTIVGQHTAAGTKDALGSGENQNAIAVYGSTNVLIERVDIRRVGGDCLYVSAHERRIWSDGVTFRDSTCRLTGRMGVTVIAGSRVRVVNNTFDEIGYAVVGIEPDAGNEGARDVVVRDNTVGSYSLTDQYEGFLFYACNAPWSDGAVVRDVTVSGNTVAGNLAGKGGMRGIHTLVCANVTPTNYTITNNTAAKAVAGPVLRILGANGVTVTGNKQPLSSGSLATFSGSTNVTSDGNDT